MKFATGLAMAWTGGVAEAQTAPTTLTLDYDGRLIIKVLEIHLEEQASPRDYDAAVSLRDDGILRALHTFDIKAVAHGQVQDGAAQPGRFFYDNHDGKRDR